MAARDVLVAVLREVEAGARSALNEPQTEWPEVGRVFMSCVHLSDQEAVAAGQKSGARVADFEGRFNDLTRSITSRDRLQVVGGSEVWKVTGLVNAVRGRRRSVVVRAVLKTTGAGA